MTFPELLADLMARQGHDDDSLARTFGNCGERRLRWRSRIRRALDSQVDVEVTDIRVLNLGRKLGLDKVQRRDFLYAYQMFRLGLDPRMEPIVPAEDETGWGIAGTYPKEIRR